jgi:divinyl protochlorophyllide a 8-vinyl-reductase
MGATVAARTIGRIGPNAVTRLAEALRALHGEPVAARVFGAAALDHLLREPPRDMVDEDAVARLHGSAHAELGAATASQVSREAGLRTANYLLAHRIPRPLQRVLPWLPAPVAARVLVAAIGRHAWTFAGSGLFAAQWQRGGVRLSIAGCPLCRDIRATTPACDFYCATFERLFATLVRRTARVSESACEACGAAACVFEVRW